MLSCDCSIVHQNMLTKIMLFVTRYRKLGIGVKKQNSPSCAEAQEGLLQQ